MAQARFKRGPKKAKQLSICLALTSLCLLIAAIYFQFAEGLAPCKLCIWQRWPHGIIILLGLLSLTAVWGRLTLLVILFVAVVSSGLGIYHSGVELQLWAGPGGCTADLSGTESTSALLDSLLETDVVRCDEISWQFLSLSMANWNALISTMMALIALVGFRKFK